MRTAIVVADYNLPMMLCVCDMRFECSSKEKKTQRNASPNDVVTSLNLQFSTEYSS